MITAFFTTVLTVAALLLLAIRAAASLFDEEAKHGFYEECTESAEGPHARSLGWTFKPRRTPLRPQPNHGNIWNSNDRTTPAR